MSPKNDQPKWWQLYLICLLLIPLFAVDNRLKLSTLGHQVVQIGIVLVIYGLVHLWSSANVMRAPRMVEHRHREVVIVRYPSVEELAERYRTQHPRLKLPESEIRGMLSDTFEMDYMEAEFIPRDQATQELEKE